MSKKPRLLSQHWNSSFTFLWHWRAPLESSPLFNKCSPLNVINVLFDNRAYNRKLSCSSEMSWWDAEVGAWWIIKQLLNLTRAIVSEVLLTTNVHCGYWHEISSILKVSSSNYQTSTVWWQIMIPIMKMKVLFDLKLNDYVFLEIIYCKNDVSVNIHTQSLLSIQYIISIIVICNPTSPPRLQGGMCLQCDLEQCLLIMFLWKSFITLVISIGPTISIMHCFLFLLTGGLALVRLL